MGLVGPNSEAPDLAAIAGDTIADEEMVRRIKGQVRFRQFRLATLLTAMSLIAVVIAIPRMIGVEYARILSGFAAIYLPFFFGMPVVAIWFAWLPYGWKARHRWYLAGFVAVVAICPAVAIAAFIGAVSVLPLILAATLLVCWLPQALIIAAMWYTDRRWATALAGRRALERRNDRGARDVG